MSFEETQFAFSLSVSESGNPKIGAVMVKKSDDCQNVKIIIGCDHRH